uniref:leucine-rich repeat neuronal protein 4 n=1 Tax=Scatophagus argus TaxID=75038 RepID=UPI001ED7FE34|nr:leucine-rich repeat neuronal protein 4 [Scatophagus argus]
MAASRDLPFPLVIMCLVLIRGYSSLPTTSGVAGTNPMRSPRPRGFPTGGNLLNTEDYSEYEDTVTPVLPKTVPPNRVTPKRCDYNPCLQSQIPCADLAASTGCLCPGSTLHNEPPQAPDLRSVSWNGSEVVIWWCAPNSYVTAYIVKVEGKERQKFGKDQRNGGVGNIDHNSEVCVVAVNDAGQSDGSCMMYQSRDSSLPLKAGLIGGALGFLVLLLLAVLFWRYKTQRKQQASISMHDTAETQ